jgi:hypothetical protein
MIAFSKLHKLRRHKTTPQPSERSNALARPSHVTTWLPLDRDLLHNTVQYDTATTQLIEVTPISDIMATRLDRASGAAPRSCSVSQPVFSSSICLTPEFTVNNKPEFEAVLCCLIGALRRSCINYKTAKQWRQNAMRQTAETRRRAAATGMPKGGDNAQL